MVAALAACGGGGGGGTTEGAASTAPTVTTPGTATTATTTSTAPEAAGTTAVTADTGAATQYAATQYASTSAANTTASASTSESFASPAPAPAPAAAPVATGSSGASPQVADCDMFPSNAIFNTRIDDTSRFPAHAMSNSWISMVGGDTQFMPNWGGSSDPNNLRDYWGIPINVVDNSTTQWPVVSFDYSMAGLSERTWAERSDCATSADGSSTVSDCSQVPANARRFPFPSGQTLAEGGNCGGPGGCGDHHVLVVEKGACRLWEAQFAHNLGGQWYAVTTAMWNLRSNALRPDGWASGDAAGLPITPLLAKASEAATGEIRHALRVTFRNQFIGVNQQWPARFSVGLENPSLIPMGSLLRLKADFVIPDNWSTQAKAVALAAKRYGLYVADNGMDFFVQGEPSNGWDPAAWQQLRNAITLQNMEFVDLRAITSDPRFNKDSMQASW